MEPINNELVSCIERGFQQFLRLMSGLDQISEFVEFQPRTKASIIHNFIRSNTQQAFSDKENIRVGEFNKVFGITVEDQFFIRFKKMDRNLTVSSYRTTQYQKYLSQEHIEGFPKDPTFLFAGYIPNRTWPILKVFILHVGNLILLNGMMKREIIPMNKFPLISNKRRNLYIRQLKNVLN